ncbi:NVEALA domain-containing protein [Bacteroidales bacterium OttesenSCG-928-L03]|nr:NVEALA domain-containing protein [Bacteroidales bacterium OttesenSCG-928-L03]
MKKKIFGGILVIALAVVAAFNVNLNSGNNELSLLCLANVEALAVETNSPGEWTVTVSSPISWKCDRGGNSCCPMLSGAC